MAQILQIRAKKAYNIILKVGVSQIICNQKLKPNTIWYTVRLFPIISINFIGFYCPRADRGIRKAWKVRCHGGENVRPTVCVL